MQTENNFWRDFWQCVAIAIGIVLAVFIFSSCNTKKIQGYTKDVYDSLYVSELEEKIKVLEIENGELTARVNELEFFDVEFDNNCDSILKAALLKSGCNTDSVNAILELYKSRIKTFSDGTVEAEGFIKSLRRSKQRNEELITKYQHTIDSLKSINKKDVHWKQVVTIEKTTKVKRGIYWWVWFLIGYGVCILLPPQRAWNYIKMGVAKIPFSK